MKDPVKDPKMGYSAWRMIHNVMGIPPRMNAHRLPKSIREILAIMHQFPQFEEDFPDLYFSKIIKAKKDFNKISKDDEWECSFTWDRSHTGLAEYFHNMKKNEADGKFFWGKIENVFSIKRGTLRHLIDNNNGTPSKAYDEIKN